MSSTSVKDDISIPGNSLQYRKREESLVWCPRNPHSNLRTRSSHQVCFNIQLRTLKPYRYFNSPSNIVVLALKKQTNKINNKCIGPSCHTVQRTVVDNQWYQIRQLCRRRQRLTQIFKLQRHQRFSM
ncbi:unnamed protein product [Heterobilharzia americana]|nr:unnamed protein product [Heterobilharzia americana]